MRDENTYIKQTRTNQHNIKLLSWCGNKPVLDGKSYRILRFEVVSRCGKRNVLAKQGSNWCHNLVSSVFALCHDGRQHRPVTRTSIERIGQSLESGETHLSTSKWRRVDMNAGMSASVEMLVVVSCTHQRVCVHKCDSCRLCVYM